MGEKNKTSRSKEKYEGLNKSLLKINKEESTKLNKTDRIIIAIILALTVLLTFIRLGSWNTPETFIETAEKNATVIFELPEKSKADSLFIHAGISDKDSSNVTVYVSNNYTLTSTSWTYQYAYNAKNSNMYRFMDTGSLSGKSFNYLILRFDNEKMRINEVVVTDVDGNPIECKIVYSSGLNSQYPESNLLDEQDKFEGGYNSFNGMYFDEVYHARTAYEFINGWSIYEWTHPPLGKILISLGILMFGMNPFGWRFMGALFSIATVFVMYLFGKKVFKKTMFAVALSIFSLCEGLRFTLGRIATVDVFLGFFVVLSFYFMYTFFEKGVDPEHIMGSLVPFGFSGIFFGLAFCTKWNGAYAGIGLLILFIIVFVKTVIEFIKCKNAISDDDYTKSQKTFVKKFPLMIIGMIATGIIFFVCIPACIYFLQYLVFRRSQDIGELIPFVIDQQKRIFNYHAKDVVGSVHNSASPWWSWIFNGKSVYFALSDSFYGGSTYSRIHCMMITATTVFGIWAIVYFLKYLITYFNKKRKQVLTPSETALMEKIKTPLIFFFVAMLANWLPWAFVSRTAYIYHFYESATFLLFIITLYLYVKYLLESEVAYSGEIAILNGKKKDVTYGMYRYLFFVCIYAVNFVLFLPVLSGSPVSHIAAMFMFGWANLWFGYGLIPPIF